MIGNGTDVIETAGGWVIATSMSTLLRSVVFGIRIHIATAISAKNGLPMLVYHMRSEDAGEEGKAADDAEEEMSPMGYPVSGWRVLDYDDPVHSVGQIGIAASMQKMFADEAIKEPGSEGDAVSAEATDRSLEDEILQMCLIEVRVQMGAKILRKLASKIARNAKSENRSPEWFCLSDDIVAAADKAEKMVQEAKTNKELGFIKQKNLSEAEVTAVKKVITLAINKSSLWKWMSLYDDDVVTINTCRSGRAVAWAMPTFRGDKVKNICIYIDSLEKLSRKELTDELL